VLKSKDHVWRDEKKTPKRTEPGLVYSLPKGSLQLAAERKQVAAEVIQKAKEAAEAAKVNVENSLKAWNAAKENQARLEGELAVAEDTVKPKLQESVSLAKATAKYALSVKEANELIAKAAKDKYDAIADKKDKWVETASLTVLPNSPDGNARYVTRLSHNATRDDNVKLTVVNGMLASSTATATDQLPNILLSIAQTIGATNLDLPKFTSQDLHIRTVSPDLPDAQEVKCEPYNVSLVFDPTDPVDTYKKLELLAGKKPGFFVTIGAISSKDPTCPAEQAALLPGCVAGECNGLYYRVPIAVETRFESMKAEGCELKSSPIALSSVVVVPDSRHTYLMPTRAGAFTTSKLAFLFKEGMPIDYGIERPSEVASIASIPVQVAKALVSIPAEIIQLRVNHDTQANALIAAETAELAAQVEKLRAQQALDEAQRAVAAGLPIPAPAADTTSPP
jgi:hypothetical protein